MRSTHALPAAALTAALAVPGIAGAAIINSDLGNTSPGFNDGNFVSVPQIAAAQAGQPAPFDQSYGNDLFGPDFDQTWTHSYGAIVDPLVAATLTIGIADHDSQANGSQVQTFLLDGSAQTAQLDALFEASGGGESATGTEYNEYTLDLLALGLGPSLIDGMLDVQLALQGPGLLWNLLQGTAVESNNNGAFLISSSLTIETQDLGQPVPAPATLSLLGLGLVGLGARRRPRRA